MVVMLYSAAASREGDPWIGVLAGLFFVAVGASELRTAVRTKQRFGLNPPPPRSWLLRHTGMGLSRRHPGAGMIVGVLAMLIGAVVAVTSLVHALGRL